MSIRAKNDAEERENVVDSEHDSSSPPAKMARTELEGTQRQDDVDTLCSEGSEISDEDFCTGDAIRSSEIDSNGSDSPPAESDRLTPVPDFRCDDSDSSEETLSASSHGDLLKDAENITESSDSSHHSPVHTENNESNLRERSNSPDSPPNVIEQPESNRGAVGFY